MLYFLNVIVTSAIFFFCWNFLLTLAAPRHPVTRLLATTRTSVPLFITSSSKFQTTRFYSCTKKVQIRTDQQGDSPALDPNWVTGFSDGEGCMYVSIVKIKKYKVGWRVKPSFHIKLHRKDKPVLDKICKLLKVGRIYEKGPSAVEFNVISIKELEAVINHFDKYPLNTQKRADYLLWKKIVILIKRKEHLTPEGLRQIVAIRAAMNLGLSDKLKLAFPDVVPVERSIVKPPNRIEPEWFAGFTSAEGCFLINVIPSKTQAVGFQVKLVFQLTQHSRDVKLLIAILEYLDCGGVYKKGIAFDYRVTKFSDTEEKIIPFFLKYPIKGVKALDFEDFCRTWELMKEKKHLTAEGLEQIKKIKAGMNRGRKI